MKQFLCELFEEHNYPEEARASLLSDYEKLWACDESREVFEKYLNEYKETDRTNFGEFIVLAAKAGNAASVDGRATQFICFLLAAEHLREMYIKKDLPLSVYHDTMRDMRYKLMECYKMHGVWGSFVASWFYGAFVLGRFELGRLQYEFANHFATKENYTIAGIELINDYTPIFNLHIPSSGPLTQEAVEESLSVAYEFMKKYHPHYLIDGKMVIECSSWLLFRDHEKFIPENSNIRRFMENFAIVESWYDDNFGDCWRIFNKDWDGDAASLPRDTALQRAYADWMAAGNKAGEANGIFVYDGKNIIKE